MNRGMDSVKEPMRNVEKCLDSQLWHACAGGMVQMPSVNSKVVYFPQGHAEHAQGNVDFGNARIPSLIPCRVSATKYMADLETDEIFAKISLLPLRNNEFNLDDDYELLGHDDIRNQEKPSSFAKTLTQSDANNGGGFSVPRYCAETIFPPLDYSAEPPVQTILAKDVHGEIWKFRHIYRGTPRRHLLTTGWSNFVNQKKLVAGDSIVFLRAETGDLCVGVRRAKRGIGCGIDYSPGWNPANSGSSLMGYSDFMRENEGRMVRRHSNGNLNGRVKVESVIEAATLAASGKRFEIVYYPCAGTPEFVVRASTVRSAMQIHWYSAMRFKMPFETEDSSRISWFMGTISSIQVADPVRWPDSPWRMLQVSWDEPDLLQNVKSVNPWLVEVVVNMPAIHVSPFLPPRKKPRYPLQAETAVFGHLPMPSFSTNFFEATNPFQSITASNIPAGIQGARHTQFGLSSSNLQISIPPLRQFPAGLKHLEGATPIPVVRGEDSFGGTKSPDNQSHWLTVGNHIQSSKETKETKPDHIILFGQLILPNQQSSNSSSGDTTNASDANLEKASNLSDGSGLSSQQNGSLDNSSDGGSTSYNGPNKTGLSLDIGHCEVFMELENVSHTLDLSVLGSYEELYRKLGNMFSVGRSEMLNSVLYQDALGATKQAGDEPFSKFMRTARRLTILANSRSRFSKKRQY
ncbi:auxin response factor 16-like [Cucurbita pepo subsp. pepo]|uniref:auxin response factor 16-like n=1 Tax=Cucurbita pepo subsp. pepo TaxID=3664 RepID=UPI000C9DA1FE|nr:auxin response factor 16-like [Cucurbita pepo subsp. pepo]